MSDLDNLTTIHKKIGSISTKISVLEDRRKTQVSVLSEYGITTKNEAKKLRKKLIAELEEQEEKRDNLKDEILGDLKKMELTSDEY